MIPLYIPNMKLTKLPLAIAPARWERRPHGRGDVVHTGKHNNEKKILDVGTCVVFTVGPYKKSLISFFKSLSV